jgi:hypothetical protein
MDKGEFHRGAEKGSLEPILSRRKPIFRVAFCSWRNSISSMFLIAFFTPQHDILVTTMSTVQEIKQAVRKLPLSKRLKVVKWVTAFDNDEWDKEMSKDASSGKLNFLVREGKEALKKGRLQPFPRP